MQTSILNWWLCFVISSTIYSSRSQSVVRHCPRSGPRRPQVNYCDISYIQLRTKKTVNSSLLRENAIPHWSVTSECWFGARKSWNSRVDRATLVLGSRHVFTSCRKVQHFTVLQSNLHQNSRAGKLSRDMGILLFSPIIQTWAKGSNRYRNNRRAIYCS